MITLCQKIFKMLTKQEKVKIIYLTCGIFLMGVIEVVAVASILPFMMLVTNPTIIQTHPLLRNVFQTLGFSSNDSFLLFLGSGVFFTIVLGNIFSAFMTWRVIRFSFQQGRTLSNRLFQHYLAKHYEFFILNHSAELVKNILHEVNRFVTGLLLPVMQMLVKGFVAVFILGMLFYVDPILALSITAILGGVYCAIFLMIKKRLGIWGRQASTLHAQRFKVISEAFDGIKELKVHQKQSYFTRLFDFYSKPLAEVEAKQLNAPQATRYILEAFAFGGILLVVLYLTFLKKETSTMIPLLALYAFSGYRLMPALQQIFSGLSLAKYNHNALDILFKELNNFAYESQVNVISKETLVFEQALSLKHIHYTYPKAKSAALKNISLTLQKNTLIGFVGKTGSGKSTLAYILSGLLKPTSGQVCIDNQSVKLEDLQRLQKTIGYVPQTIFLTDDSFIQNIAFGMQAHDINKEAVIQAAKRANIHDFIMSLPQGYETQVGEKGVTLSGGQKQRIGIARAIYHEPKLLIFDEATSALDTITEKQVLQELEALRSNMTVIMIAHRLVTVKSCDQIYLFEHGAIVSCGSYETLVEQSSLFYEMSQA